MFELNNKFNLLFFGVLYALILFHLNLNISEFSSLNLKAISVIYSKTQTLFIIKSYIFLFNNQSYTLTCHTLYLCFW